MIKQATSDRKLFRQPATDRQMDGEVPGARKLPRRERISGVETPPDNGCSQLSPPLIFKNGLVHNGTK